ncbi:RNA polymerase sporulation sigma factor SigG [Mammaliicoccus sciuri]|uniref:RNA polymerase sigma factor n=2 Tax=Sporosarcina newyorkensis TaxID=759851 RepID=A0A1T4YEW3_9BACL|nr:MULTISPECIES: RNA polymerase sporulation sigma factor SigG [Sporosarcina]EGQ27270.1 DNA-directed RNA polymerase sigma subunit SigG [Sporosarcina newyorkensis 2681]MBY0222137.1 RNA polymerase sporulation sigma factor SigG [Sporosarcina aquimarina]SKB00377.1 RNA polymerase, sigma subunit, RpsG/SigG [Sporosarcina newyorkensis]
MVRTRVEICGINTSELPLLTSDVMKETFIRLQSGDEFARDELVFANLRLVLSLVQRFNYRGEQADDLFQVGCIGLLKAIDNFDLKHNVRFSTYAVPMIIGEIKRHLRDHHAVRVSRSLRDIAYKAIKAKEEYINEHQHEPRISDLEKITGIPEEDILFALDAIQDPMSLHEPMNSDGGDPIYMMDQLQDQRVSEERWMTYVSIKESVEELNERQQLIVSKRFYLGQTQTEIAKELGISQAQISRIEKHAMDKIRLGIEQKNS